MATEVRYSFSHLRVIEREELPVVAINLLTKNRTELAVRAIHQCLRYLRYEGRLMWFVTDNGSEPAHHERLGYAIPPMYVLGGISQAGSIGACWNTGLREIFNHTEYYLRLEDDMCLKVEMNITRWVKIMMMNTEIGMIRLGQMVPGLDFESRKYRIYTHVGHEEDILLRVGKGVQYCYSGHPALFHKRFHDYYGYFPETEISAGELELSMDSSVRANGGPDVYFPWDTGKYGTWGAWDHVGVRSAE